MRRNYCTRRVVVVVVGEYEYPDFVTLVIVVVNIPFSFERNET